MDNIFKLVEGWEIEKSSFLINHDGILGNEIVSFLFDSADNNASTIQNRGVWREESDNVAFPGLH